MMAAIDFSNRLGKKLKFHINGSRHEQSGDRVYKNIVNLFEANPDHELVEHEWLPHKDFIQLVKFMDMGLQVSFSETFNIVAADFAWNNIPIVGSKEISWMSSLYKANPTNLNEIVNYLWLAYSGKFINLHRLNKIGLIAYNKVSLSAWKSLLFNILD